MIYRLDEDEEGYYLESYDEMHNHMLVADSGFMPFPKNYVVRPTFITPIFTPFLQIMARERCFELYYTRP